AGTDVVAWVLLDQVPLGYELWRQFNAFPPNFRPLDAGSGGTKDGGKEGGAPKSPTAPKADIKLPKR
ncbi:MAG: hypothetical protein ACKO5K_12275, partial [Armatimonadota bacterium]